MTAGAITVVNNNRGGMDFSQTLKRVKDIFTKDNTLFKATRSRRHSSPTTPLPNAFNTNKLDPSNPLNAVLLPTGKADAITSFWEKTKRCSMSDIDLPKEHLNKLAEAGFLPLGPIQPLQQPPNSTNTKKQCPRPHKIDTALGKTPLRNTQFKGEEFVPGEKEIPVMAPISSSKVPVNLVRTMPQEHKRWTLVDKQSDKPPSIRKKESEKPTIIQFAETYKATMVKIRYVEYYPLQQRMQIKMFKKKIEDKKAEIVQQSERSQQLTQQQEKLYLQKNALEKLRLGKEGDEKIRERCTVLVNQIHTLLREQIRLGHEFNRNLFEATGLGENEPVNSLTFREMDSFLKLMQGGPQLMQWKQPKLRPAVNTTAAAKVTSKEQQKILDASPPHPSEQQQQLRKKTTKPNEGQQRVEKEQFKKRSKPPQTSISLRTPEEIEKQLTDIKNKTSKEPRQLPSDKNHNSHASPVEFDYKKHYPHLPQPLVQHNHIDEFYRLLATDLYDYKACKTLDDVVILQKRWRHTRYMLLLLGVNMKDVPDQAHPVSYILKSRREKTYQERTVSMLWDGSVEPLTVATSERTKMNNVFTNWFLKQQKPQQQKQQHSTATTNSRSQRKTSLKKKASLKRRRLFKKVKANAIAMLAAALAHEEGGSRAEWSLLLFHTAMKRRRNSTRSIKSNKNNKTIKH